MHGIIRERAYNWMAVAGGLLVLWMGGCGDKSGNPDPATVVRNVTVTPPVVEEGGVAIVEVFVTDESGSPLGGKTVYLSADPDTSGAFSSNFGVTDGSGVATVTFTAIHSGPATISARAEPNQRTVSAAITIEKNVAINNNGQIVLTITPSLLPADGRSTASILAEVSDNVGNPVADTTAVRFTAGEKFTDVNGDGIWTENVDQLVYDADADGSWDAMGVIDPIVYTRNGRVTATFTAGNSPGLVYIKVTAGAVGHEVSDDVALSLTSSDPINTIALTPEWQRIQVRGTGGIEWARIVAEAFDEHGNPAPEGQPIDFSITAGPGGGETIDGEPAGPVTVFTNSLGEAVVTLNAGTIPGTVFMRARAGTVVSEATQVAIRSGPAAFISCGAELCNVPSWEFVGYINKITAVVVDQWGNEVADSTSVHFETEQGLIEGADETRIVPTLRGKAITYWNSGAPKNDGYVFYWCETSGGTVADTSFFIESGPASSGSFLARPNTLPAANLAHGEVIIEVLDVNGVYVRDGYPIEVFADHGTIESGALVDGCHYSVYIVEYFSQVLDQDFSYTIPDDGVGAIATIRARAGGPGGFNGTVQVVLTTGRAYSENSTIEMQTALSYGASTPIEVTIKDRNGNPLGGHSITVASDASGGAVAGSPRYTNEYGAASGFTFTATSDTSVTAAYITATDLDPRYGGLTLFGRITLQR